MIKHSRGFTLIELMVTISIMAILAVIAVPAFQNMLLKYNMNKSVRELAMVLQEARSQAVAQRKEVTVDLTKTAATLTDSEKTDIANKSLYLWQPSGKAYLLKKTSNIIIYQLNGSVKKMDGGKKIEIENDFTIEVCNKQNGDLSRTVTVSRTGAINQVIAEGGCK